VIFLFMGSVSGEKQSGSAALTLTKNLSHFSFIMAKLVSAVTMFLASLVIAVLICYGYTFWLFGTAGSFLDVVQGALAYAMFNLVLISITILASTISQSTTISAILAFCGFILLTLTGYVPKIGRVLPGTLLSKSVELSAGSPYQEFIFAIVITFGLVALCLFFAVQSIKRQEI
jgi:ABC-2 type transport system permease protein